MTMVLLKAKKEILYGFITLIFIFMIVGVYYKVAVATDLPSDKEMIADLQAHRNVIEELIRRYRNYERDSKTSYDEWVNQSDTLQLMQKAKIFSIDYTAYSPWLPNPYSIETAKQLDKAILDKSTRPFAMFYKYGMLRIEFKPWQRYRTLKLIKGSIWKSLIYIPEVPKIEAGYLLGPIHVDGSYSFKKRVVSSADRMPANWIDFECVYRKIEPQWFISLCNGH